MSSLLALLVDENNDKDKDKILCMFTTFNFQMSRLLAL